MSTALRAFEDMFGPGGVIHIVRAPGRVNLIGEHTDYNDGFVLPIAIEPEIRIAFRARHDSLIRIVSESHTGQPLEMSLNETIRPEDTGWRNYARGVIAGLCGAGIPLHGIDALVTSTVPTGAGLSSSAALCVGIARAMLAAADHEMPSEQIARICKIAEHEFAGVPCGIMDQMITAAAKADHAMLLDCRSLETRYVPIDPARLRIVIANSMTSRELAGSDYATRRDECEQAVAFFRSKDQQIGALRDVTPNMLNSAQGQMPEKVFLRCRHVVSENARILQAASHLQRGDCTTFGQLMLQSHASLRDDFEVSTPRLDFLVEQAMQIDGAFGARMTGGGFGGCIVALVRPDKAVELAGHLRTTFARQFGAEPDVFSTSAARGASLLR